MLIAVPLSILLVVVCFVVHYTGLRYMAVHLMERRTQHPHRLFIISMLAIFLLHIIEVSLFAVGYYVGEHHALLGHLYGDRNDSFLDALYASAEIYSSLGFGDRGWPR